MRDLELLLKHEDYDENLTELLVDEINIEKKRVIVFLEFAQNIT
jgi:hypothetical protein